MNKMIKTLTSVSAGLLVATAAFGQSGPVPALRFLPLLSGYNVELPTNATINYGSSNFLYTSLKGQVLSPYSNNVTGYGSAALTNNLAPDAFAIAMLAADANGDINANTAVGVYIGNTNWIPLVVTNSLGQWFVAPAGFTNNAVTTAYAGWPLAAGTGYPNWMYPATTNYYPQYTDTATNVVTVTLYRSPAINPTGGTFGPNQGPNPSFANQMWETTSQFSFTVTPNGITPVCYITNCPVGWLAGAKHVYCALSCPPNSAKNGYGILINQVGILQPQP